MIEFDQSLCKSCRYLINYGNHPRCGNNEMVFDEKWGFPVAGYCWQYGKISIVSPNEISNRDLLERIKLLEMKVWKLNEWKDYKIR